MLDPELHVLLKVSRHGNYPAFSQSGIEQARKNVKLLAAATALPAVEVHSVENFEIPTEDGYQVQIRVYKPWPAAEPLPALLYFHGGGFVLYDIDDYDSFCRFMTMRAGIVMVAVNYRRAPEHRFPSPYTDAVIAQEWLFMNASMLGVDQKKIAVGGDSVGGNLATFLANTCITGIPLCLQVLIYPVLVFNRNFPSYAKYGSGYFLDKEMMSWFWKLFSNPHYTMHKDERLHPYLTINLRHTAPVVMVVAEYDILRDEALDYYRRLEQQGNKACLLYFDNLGHNFILLGGRIKACRAAIEKIATTLKERLHHLSTI